MIMIISLVCFFIHPDKGQTHDLDTAVSWLESRVNRRLEGPQDEFLTKKLSKLNR